jgi:hypothetical protein
MDQIAGNAMVEAKAMIDQRQVNPEALKGLGTQLLSKFKRYEADRKLAELKWARNERQYLGQYDQEVEKILDPNRSRAYPKLTRVKVVSMLSRLMNLLFQADDKCWGIEPTAVPDLNQEDLQSVLDKLLDAAQGGDLPDEAIEQAVRDFAKIRAARLELEVEDQLQELGGSRSVSFTQLCRKVLQSGIKYGMGVLKGPFTEKQTQRKWQKDISGRYMAVPFTAYRPRFDFVPIWDYYPDMSARYLHQMEGQFERHVMSKHHFMMLKQRLDYFPSQIDQIIQTNPNGNYVRKAFETELRTMGIQEQVTDIERNKFEVMSWEGYVSGRDLSLAGVDVPEAKMDQDLRASVWFDLSGIVIKADLDPWSELETDGEMPVYHQFVFEEDESTIVGQGLPNIMRDSQMNLAASVRMMIDNGAIQRVFELNTSVLSPNQDTTSITPDKIIYREDESIASAQIPALKVIELPMHVTELKGMVDMFQGFADQETFVNPSTGGDMQRGPSEPFRTAAGASMIQGNAALPFKDVVRNFDRFTESVIGSLIVFNKNFNPNPEISGDFKPLARGATSLIAKEVLGIQLDNFVNTLHEDEKPYVKFRELVRARARVRDLIVDDVVMNDSECDAVDASRSQQQQAEQAMVQKEREAAIRLQLAESLKAVTQGSKNSSAADATVAKVILDAMEKGLPIESALRAIAATQPGGNDGTSGPQGGGAQAPGSGIQQPDGAGLEGAQETLGGPAPAPAENAAAMPAQ